MKGLLPRPANTEPPFRAALVFGMVMGVLVAAGSALPDSRIREKQAEARRILAQVESLGHSLDRATEAYNGATYRLAQIHASLRENRLELRVARHNFDVAERVLAMRVRRLYTSPTGDSTPRTPPATSLLMSLLGPTSISPFRLATLSLSALEA